MAQPFRSDDESEQSSDQDTVDAAGSDTTAEQTMLNDDARRHAEFAELEARFAHTEHAVAEDFRRRNMAEKATELENEALDYLRDADREMTRADQEFQEAHELRKHDEIERLALVIKDQPRTEIMDLNSAVTNVTNYVHNLDDRALSTVTDGNMDAARRLRATVLTLGSSIRHALGRAISDVDAARRVVQELMDFVSVVMSIAERIAAFWEFVHQFPVLLRFLV